MSGNERYQLRHAAGKYWLLDMQQPDRGYNAPVAVNDSGAMILEIYLKTGDMEAAAQKLREEYEIEKDEALADVKDFLEQLRRQGVNV